MDDHHPMEGCMDKSASRIGRMFDDISPTYDLLNRMLSMSIDLRWRERMIDELGPIKGEEVLDIATGTGDMAVLARTRTGCSIVGLDLSRNMLEVAELKWGKRFEGEHYPSIQGDALHLPLKDGSFDKAMVSFGVRNMTDIGGFIDEMHRVLRARGRLAILEFSVPRYPLVRQLYLAYLTRILPFIGGLQSGNRAAYQYLSVSIQRFPSPESMEALFQEKGFKVERSLPQTLGICHLYVIEKA
jgi:demethylmenaquinone methyltransferase/2-methoxy-6-polyprenyl-1,4-benzoquinol methylase